MSSSRPRLVLSAQTNAAADQIRHALGNAVEILAEGQSSDTDIDGILFAGINAERYDELQLCVQGFLDVIPDGLVLVDSGRRIVWRNQAFQDMLTSKASCIGGTFAEAFENAQTLDSSPFQLPLNPELNQTTKTILKTGEREFVALRASTAPLASGGEHSQPFTTIVVRNVSEEILENQKREALYKAGIELGDLSPEEVTDMSHEDRSELLKEKILDYAQHILGFETIELRALNAGTNELVPLLEVGMQQEAAGRQLFAVETGNGVTGYVAATRKSHLCRDTKTDSLYLSGAADARSSLTVPLIMHDEVLGTFNVESPGTQVYDEKDLEFLEVFADVVAMAVNQLQLLVAEKLTTVNANSDRLRREVALPTDDILSSATAILEKYIGHDPDVCEKLQTIVANTREIRRKIGRVSEEVGATETGFPSCAWGQDERPALKGKRVLVTDGDETVLTSAHDLLERLGCTVEGVRSGAEACQMVRSHHYDVVLTDINLSDMSGFDCFCRVQEINDRLPVILMTGFGYDPGHSIVKSRQRGLKSVLYKPFRREQLLTEVEKAVTPPPPVS